MKINNVKEVYEKIHSRENRIQEELQKIMEAEKVINEAEKIINEIKSEKIKFNWKIRFLKNVRFSKLMWYVEIYEVKWKTFDVVDGYVLLKWYEQWPCDDCKTDIERKIYFENLLNYWEIL